MSRCFGLSGRNYRHIKYRITVKENIKKKFYSPIHLGGESMEKSYFSYAHENDDEDDEDVLEKLTKNVKA